MITHRSALLVFTRNLLVRLQELACSALVEEPRHGVLSPPSAGDGDAEDGLAVFASPEPSLARGEAQVLLHEDLETPLERSGAP